VNSHINQDEIAEKRSLYFIGIVPDEPVCGQIDEFKLLVKEKFSSSSALKSPPHITLIPPFHWDEKEEYILVDSIKKYVEGCYSCEIELCGFDVFSKSRVLFIKPEINETLGFNRKVLLEHLTGNLNINFPEIEYAFMPHITIGFKDWKSSANFQEAAKYFKAQHYHASFNAHSISVLKFVENHWDILYNFEMD